jgi:hypothetical protein
MQPQIRLSPDWYASADHTGTWDVTGAHQCCHLLHKNLGFVIWLPTLTLQLILVFCFQHHVYCPAAFVDIIWFYELWEQNVFDMTLKFSWKIICILVLLRTSVLESCCILVSMVYIARCDILMMVVLRIHVHCDAALLCEWSLMFLRECDFWKRVTSQKIGIVRFDVSDDGDVACLLNTGT